MEASQATLQNSSQKQCKVVGKVTQLSACTGGQKLLEAYARVQQLRGMPTAAPATIGPALQQTSKASLTDLLLNGPVVLCLCNCSPASNLLAPQPFCLKMFGSIVPVTRH